MKTFWIIHKSELGPVMECTARKSGKGWSVLVRTEFLTWRVVQDEGEWEPLSAIKSDHTLIEGEWPDEQ
jgi:hypothetical protein